MNSPNEQAVLVYLDGVNLSKDILKNMTLPHSKINSSKPSNLTPLASLMETKSAPMGLSCICMLRMPKPCLQGLNQFSLRTGFAKTHM